MKHKPASVFKDDAQKATGLFRNRHLCTAKPDNNKYEHEFRTRGLNTESAAQTKSTVYFLKPTEHSLLQKRAQLPQSTVPHRRLCASTRPQCRSFQAFLVAVFITQCSAWFLECGGVCTDCILSCTVPFHSRRAQLHICFPILQKQEITTLHPIPA